MSSTYSTNLAIELMGAGEQAGNWGSTTNTNLGTLIEQAISGVVTQAMADALYHQSKGDETKLTAYLAKCEAVKSKYPKPT